MRSSASGLFWAPVALAILGFQAQAGAGDASRSSAVPSPGETLRETRGISLGAHAQRSTPLESFSPALETSGKRSPATGLSFQFLDASAAAGLSLPAGLYFSASWADLDDDGDLDLTIPLDADSSGCLRIWRNDAGHFVDITESYGLGCVPFVRSAAWLDLDDDGDLDLFLTRRSSARTNLIYENVSGSLVRRSVPVLESPATDVTQAWADFDGDGDLDLYLPGVILAPQRLLLRTGPFQFEDASAAVELDAEVSAVAGAWGDYDDDGDPDLAVGLDAGIRLYRNEAGQRFEDVTGAGAQLPGFLVLPSWADVDADGDLDLLAGGFFPPRLFENRVAESESAFVDRTLDWGSGFAGSTGGGWADLDLDGDLDLLDDGGSDGAHVHRNDVPDGGQLVDVTAEAGLPQTPGIGWQPVVGDFDADGRPDFFVPHEAGRALYRNVSPAAGRWVRLRLVDAAGQPAIGARIRYEDGPRLQVREVSFPGMGFGFASTDVLLALGRRGAAARVEVRWPNGEVETIHGLPAGRLHVVRQGIGVIRHPFARALEASRFAAGAPAQPGPAKIETDCNPCRRAVRFTLPEASAEAETDPSLLLYDARGRLVRTLPVFAGSASWDLRTADGRAAPAGVYWVRSRRAFQAGTTRIVVLR